MNLPFGDGRGRLLLVLLMTAGALPGTAAGDEPARPPEQPVVRLIIDFGDGVEKHYTRLAWTADMTVMDVMQLAAKHPRGVTFKHRGKGATAFLTQIDDLENEGRGRNWIYRVDGQLGDVGFALKKLPAGARVRWTFGGYP